MSGLTPLLAGSGDRQWLAAALSDDDRAAVAERGVDHTGDSGPDEARIDVEVDGIRATLLAVDAQDLRLSYDVVCNETLWYTHHHLFDLARRPTFDNDWFAAWAAYRRVNEAFAIAVATIAPQDAAVLVQDYHLCLLGPMLHLRRPDLRTVHFSHTPFATPDLFDVLPEMARRELLVGLAGHGACGFHTDRWEAAFLGSCARAGIEPPATFVSPLGPDEADLKATLISQSCQDAIAALDGTLAGRRLIARVDRIELSKNLLRGFEAFDTLLEGRPNWRNKVSFAASVYPSRESNDDYVAYRSEVSELVERINARWATVSWTPIIFNDSDNYPMSVATLARADVVLVNPVRDGLNLVAKEAMLINQRDALLALSPEAGAWAEFEGVATAVHPFDVIQTANVLDELLSLDGSERAQRASTLREIAARRTPADWLEDQVAAADHSADSTG